MKPIDKPGKEKKKKDKVKMKGYYKNHGYDSDLIDSLPWDTQDEQRASTLQLHNVALHDYLAAGQPLPD